MASQILKERFAEIERLARAAGIDPYEVLFFEVPTSVIYTTASYGLPTRYSHWSFGKIHQYQRTQGEMGFSKIYELILNCDPSYAFLDKGNTDTANLMIAAHCYGHSDFFKNNIMFKRCGETNMIQVAKRHAEIIDDFRKDYGDDEVDDWLDVALALEQHIDVYRGFHRKRYDDRHIEYEERVPTDWEDLVEKEHRPLLKRIVKNIHIPPHLEKDLLWFLTEYSNIEPWQKRIFEIVRRESYYFFPQFRTKVLNEGWASFCHAELMRQYALGDLNDYGVPIEHPLTTEEHLDFVALHEKVVQPGFKMRLKVDVPEVDQFGRPTGKVIKQWRRELQQPGVFRAATRINPYYVGFKMFRDIKKRWDEYYKKGYREDELHGNVPVNINGDQKVREVMQEEDDVSFFRNYLTEELCQELHLFAYGSTEDYDDSYAIQEDIIEREKSDDDLGVHDVDGQIIENKTVGVKSKELKDIISYFAKARNNYGVPLIVVRRVDETGLLRLEHLPEDGVNLDISYAEHVLKYVGKVWNRPIEIIRRDKDLTRVLKFDGMTFEVDHEAPDYADVLESIEVPSSW